MIKIQRERLLEPGNQDVVEHGHEAPHEKEDRHDCKRSAIILRGAWGGTGCLSSGRIDGCHIGFGLGSATKYGITLGKSREKFRAWNSGGFAAAAPPTSPAEVSQAEIFYHGLGARTD